MVKKMSVDGQVVNLSEVDPNDNDITLPGPIPPAPAPAPFKSKNLEALWQASCDGNIQSYEQALVEIQRDEPVIFANRIYRELTGLATDSDDSVWFCQNAFGCPTETISWIRDTIAALDNDTPLPVSRFVRSIPAVELVVGDVIWCPPSPASASASSEHSVRKLVIGQGDDSNSFRVFVRHDDGQELDYYELLDNDVWVEQPRPCESSLP